MFPVAFSEPSQTSKMELIEKIVKSWKTLAMLQCVSGSYTTVLNFHDQQSWFLNK